MAAGLGVAHVAPGAVVKGFKPLLPEAVLSVRCCLSAFPRSVGAALREKPGVAQLLGELQDGMTDLRSPEGGHGEG